MKTLSIGCASFLLLCLMVAKAFPAHYSSDVAPTTKTFVDTYDMLLGEQVTIDIYLSDDMPPPLSCQNSGGVWIDFSGSTSQVAYVSAGRAFQDGSEGPIGPWTTYAGALVNEPAGPGTVMLVVSGLGGECPDADGDLIVGRVVLEMIGTDEASIHFSTIPGVATWTPYLDADVLPHTLIINDFDKDGIANGEDNCPDTPNGPSGGTCTEGVSYKIARPCLSDGECGDGGFCSMNQEDSNKNGIGDACYLCEADFTCDGDVDADDMAEILNHFGRSQYFNPCETGNPCNGDFTCDGDLDANDVAKFLEDFARSQFNNPCPFCIEGDWCVYQ
jgi:hypothetical protein